MILLLFAMLSIILGSVNLPFKDIFNAFTGGEAPQYVKDILFTYRLPKTFTAIMAGASLSICGLQMQTIFRNPLADPYILGISSGAGLGVALFVMGFSIFGTGLSGSLFSNLGIATSAWLGALTVTLLLLLLSSRLKDNLSLLIFGIMLGSVITAIISLLQYFSTSSALKVFVVWTMGSFAGLTPVQLWILTLLVIAGFIISVINIKDLNVLLAGEAYAKSLGVDLERSRKRILIATTLLAGGITAFCGPIGFIGIAVPHITRMIIKNSDHRVLLPLTALTGATVMLFADTVAQLPGQTGIIPINTVSALIGVPVILYIILKNRRWF